MTQEALRMAGIDKHFPGVHALKNVDLSLNKGEVLSLVGENGAGKSTLMNVLMGAVIPDKGTIEIEGVKHNITSPNYAIRHGIGMVPQELNIVPDISIAENIYLGMPNMKHGRIDWDTTYKKSAELLKNLNCNIDVKSTARNHNVADLQMVQIARALAFGAKIIILDEPTASLTYQESSSLFEIIKKLQKQGTSIIYISHHLEECLELSSRIMVMRDGEAVANLETASTNTKELISIMAGQTVNIDTSHRQFDSKDVFLSVKGLTAEKFFKDISFDVYKGEIFGFGGLVGAGRSEVAQTIFGYIEKKAGSIQLDGAEISPKSPSEAIDLGIGYIPEERRQQAIFPVLSIRENITMPYLHKLIKSLSISKKTQKEIAEDYISKLKVKTTDAEKNIKDLSGGNQQKVIVARWISQDLKLLILDEPTRGIDVKAKVEIHNIIRELAENGLTVIVISSEMDELIEVCDRVMVMHEGHLKGFLDTDGICPRDILNLALN